MLHYIIMEDSNGIVDWLQSSGLQILLIVAGAWIVHRFGMVVVKRIIRNAMKADDYATEIDEKRREDTLIIITSAVVRVAVYLLAVMMILSELGVDIGPLIAGASVAGVAIGFGAQSLIKDFVSGLFVIMENQYRVGDVVDLSGTAGVVQSISIRTTVLRDLDGNEHHVPNGSFTVATNKTMLYSNVNLDVPVAYDSDINKVSKVINRVGKEMAEDKDWQEHITEAPYFVRVDGFGASEIVIKVLGKVKPGQQWAVTGEYRRRLKMAFDKADIEIPFPQRVIHQSKK